VQNHTGGLCIKILPFEKLVEVLNPGEPIATFEVYSSNNTPIHGLEGLNYNSAKVIAA